MCVVAMTAISMAGNLLSGFMDLNQQKAEGKYRTQQLINQGIEAENNAAMVRQEGIETARRQKLNAILNMGKTKTNTAAGNLASSSDTVLNLLQDNIQAGNINASDTLKKSEGQAKQYISSANNFYQNAALNSMKVKQNYRNGLFNLGTKVFMQSSRFWK